MMAGAVRWEGEGDLLWGDRRANGEPNPFAVVVTAHLKALETARDPAGRYAAKWAITKGLYQRGYRKANVLELYRFIDGVLELPADLEERLLEQVRSYEEAMGMQYVASAERIGWQEGRQEGEVRVVERLPSRRFGALPPSGEARLAGAEPVLLEAWADRILDATSLEEVFRDG